MYKVRVEEPAESDFQHIITYIAETLDATAAALSFMDEVDVCYDRLQENPYLYEQCREPYLQSEGYRRAVIGNYVLVYKVLEEQKEVEVHRFFYGQQNYTKFI